MTARDGVLDPRSRHQTREPPPATPPARAPRLGNGSVIHANGGVIVEVLKGAEARHLRQMAEDMLALAQQREA